MPIKLPKGFQRRKSSGNVLDEVQNPPGQSSFRVFERPGTGGKSLDAGQSLRASTETKPLPPSKHSFELDDEGDLFSYQKSELPNRYGQRSISTPALANEFSGSGGTENSASTAPYDSASVSTRMSNASTNPSSTSIRSVQKSTESAERPFNDIPVPPTPKQRSGFLRGAHRGLSFGNKSQHDVNHTPAPPMPRAATKYDEQTSPDLPKFGRDRSVTTSSASTATPPKLFDSDLTLNSSELDSFSNMFDNIGRRSALPSPSNSSLVGFLARDTFKIFAYTTQNLLSSPPIGHGFTQQQRSAIPPPLNIDRDRNIESSPYSWTSNDGLLRSPSPTKTVVPQNTPSHLISRKALDPRALQDMHTPDMRRLNGVPNRKSPSPLGRGNNGHLSPPERTNSSQNLLSDQSPAQENVLFPESRHSFDSNLAAEADLVSKWQEKPASSAALKSNNKIMTPAQFERYRQQQEREQKLAGPSGDNHNDDSDSDHYDDDDDAERDRQAVRQRRKQEAHLAVYRQTMMKVTGEQANPRSTSGLSGKLLNSSSTDLNARMSYLTVDSRISGKSSNEEDEDEDVPLGILAAHGFPNKNRPPTRLTSASSPSVLNLTQPQAPTVVPPGIDGRRGSLPVFARNLPQDPYFGAGVVNPSQRESMGMGGGSILGVPATPNMQPYPVHPAGLVGVIASEEKSRQMRRGSPNAQGGFDMPPQHPGMPRSQTMGAMGYPDMMGMPPMLTPGEMQMNQQMAQMMQMQQQFMQQMQQMMGAQPMPMMPPPGQQSPGVTLTPPNLAQRPYSMPMPPSPGPPGQRSMSTLNPGMANWNKRPNSYFPPGSVNGGPGYAASLAPSERSNVGLAPRYRPVSTIGQENQNWKRSSTFTSGTIRPVLPGKGPAQSTVAVDEDDDDEGWKEMKAKSDNKKSRWKLKKAQTGLGDLFPNGSAFS